MEKISRLYELGFKEVINLADGARLGYVRDVEIDLECGQVKSLVIPGKLRLWGLLGREPDYVIPWGAVQQMGEDIIFVRSTGNTREKRRKKSVFSSF